MIDNIVDFFYTIFPPVAFFIYLFTQTKVEFDTCTSLNCKAGGLCFDDTHTENKYVADAVHTSRMTFTITKYLYEVNFTNEPSPLTHTHIYCPDETW